MTAFKFEVTVPAPTIVSSALGTGSGNRFTSPYDIGKAVTLGTADNYVLASTGADIDGFVTSVESHTVNQGYSFGGVQVDGRIQAVVGSDQGGVPATAMAVGDYVVASIQPVLSNAGGAQAWPGYPGTAPSEPTGPTGTVKTGTPTRKFWRCISFVSGTGAAGSVVVLERV